MLSILKPPRAGRYESTELERSARRKKTFARGFHTFSTSLAGLGLLLAKVTSAFEILVGVILVRGLIEVGLTNWKPKIAPRRTGLAKDAKTGVSIGKILSERREWSTGRIETFRIRTHDGQVVERPSESITIETE